MARSEKQAKDLAYYMALPYTYRLIPDSDEGGFVAKVEELPGCISQGDSPDEAVVRLREAMELWIEGAIEDEELIPEPARAREYSGKFQVRVPKRVHAALAEAAEQNECSLNLLVNDFICEGLGMLHYQIGCSK